ncbi:BREX-1 system phosphatase PglZ type A [Nocardia stercoris]|uniref:BREX-1 system phosphatase PglZ type A n=1 Tax=Nocardia stercoris TaxID=2483361 RepID=A0A3M2KWX5_9NOCA|nr:BREX-1 system phosphatase PglZ type A [Nocardia stercoris]RMI28950.1 BREX-1 system phosphatase PglZ type A [Nocardia stercoris]
MSRTSTISSHLADRFAGRRIVVWHDPDGGYAADLDSNLPGDVTVLRIEDNEFAVKHRVLREDTTTRFLLYRSGPIAEGAGNWLLDLELAYGPVFTADSGELMRAGLGLTQPGANALIAEHALFFADATLVDKLKALLAPSDDLVTVRAKMCAIAIGQKEHSFSELTRTLLVQQAQDSSAGFDVLSQYGLADFHWTGAEHIYGYRSESPTVPGFILWMFKQARDGFDVTSSKAARNLAIDFRSFRDSKRSSTAIKVLARNAEEDLGYQEGVAEIPWDALRDADIFEAAERETIRRLVDGLVNQTMPQRDVLEAIGTRRRDSFWFEDYATLYEALASAAELLPAIRTVRLDFTSFDQGITRYRDELFRIDQCYRQFTHAYLTAEFKQPLDELAERVEAAYVTNFLAPLGISWQQQVEAVEQWHTPAVTSQSSFYDQYVAQLTKGGHKKAVVVISDAMRYEIAEELTSKIRGENKFEAKIEALLGVLPSYTQLGMAALLPHKTLAHSPAGDPVLVDGLKSDGLASRNKILNAVGGVAVQAKDFVEMKPAERRELYSSHQVLYVYHDTIDATGDSAKSEHRTFSAVAETLDQLVDIVKKLANANATNIFVTADHGFLYQRSKLARQFNLTVKPQGDEIIAEKRRYVLGRGLKEDAGFRTFRPDQLGLSGGLEVQIPNSIHRIVKPGAGFQFVHGGASLQEIVVPVVSINKRRNNTVEPVNIDIHPESDKITTGQIVVKLYQSMKVEPHRTARRLRAGLYFGDQLISNEQEMIFDSASDQGRDRFQSVRLLLSKDADDANNQSVEFRLSGPIEGTDQWKKYKSVPYTIKRSFTTDFDF